MDTEFVRTGKDIVKKLRKRMANKETDGKFHEKISETFEDEMIDIKIIVDRNKCCYCGACVSVCPVPEGAIELEEVILKINHDICIECGICVKICPMGALSLKKNLISGK